MLHIGENVVPIQLLVSQMRRSIVLSNLTTKVKVVVGNAHTYAHQRIVVSGLRHDISV